MKNDCRQKARGTTFEDPLDQRRYHLRRSQIVWLRRKLEIEVDKRTGRATYAQGLAVNQKVTTVFTGDDSRFARMPGILSEAVVERPYVARERFRAYLTDSVKDAGAMEYPPSSAASCAR